MNANDTRLSVQPEDNSSGQTEERRHSGVYLGAFRGIRFYLDYSWFFIAVLVVYSLASHLFPLLLPQRAPAVYLGMGMVAAGLFFFSIVLHELGHSIVSQRCGIPVPSITLLFIGGIAEISREPDNARAELKIAVAGPIVSLILAAFYHELAALFAMMRFMEAHYVFWWLAFVNLYLVIFNAIPGYPLDGGRVLRALLWMRNGRFRQATYITSRIGVGFSWLLIALGAYAIFFAGSLQGLVSIFIGLFLKTAAESGYSQAIYKEILDGIRVRDLMTPKPVCVPARIPLSLAVDDYFLTNHHVAFPVVDDEGRFRGLLRLEYLKSIPREKWPYTMVSEVAEMHDSRNLQISVNASASDALRLLLVTGQGRLGVTDAEGQLLGIITRHDLLHYIHIHTELDGVAQAKA